MSYLKKFHKGIEGTGLTKTSRGAMGRVNGYNINIECSEGGYTSSAIAFYVYYSTNVNTPITKSDMKLVKEDFKKSFKKSLGCNVKKKKDFYTVFSFSKKYTGDGLMKYLGCVTMALKNSGIQSENKCYYCQQGNAESLVIDNGVLKNIHPICLNNHIEENIESIVSDKYSYIGGTFGAIIGMLVGILPSILTLLFLDSIYALLLTLVPMAILFGYKKLKGKTGYYSLILNIVLSFGSVIIMYYLAAILLNLNYTGFQLSTVIRIVNSVFFSSGNLTELLMSSFPEFIFIAIGLFLVRKEILLSHNDQMKNEKNRVEELISASSLENIVISNFD